MTDLETRLVEARSELELPPTPDLAERVVARLAPPPRGTRRRRRLVLAVAVLAAVAVGVLAASPGARGALRDLLGIGGAAVVRADELPRPGAPTGYLPGRPVSLREARAAVAFRPRLPEAGPLPSSVLLDETVSGGALSLVWCCDPALQLTQFPGSLTVAYLVKVVGPEATVEPVAVGSSPGYWISGPVHAVRFVDRAGRFHEASTRIAGDVLLWVDGDVTLRLEGDLERDEALALARTIR
jgi:hypothetical protein